MTGAISLIAGVMCLGVPGGALCDPAPAPPALPPDLAARASAVSAFPRFCQIPATPTDVRGPAAFKNIVVAIRLAGARVVAQSGPDAFSLSDTGAFAAMAKAEAAPPPPMPQPGDEGTDAFVKSALGQATPPVRH